MADLPEYKQKSGIQADSTAIGFGDALKGVSKSYQLMGEIGLDFAQKSSNEQSRLAGLEAAKMPGRELFPAFTQTDAAFNKAYLEQEYNVALTNATKFIDRSAFEASKNPSSQSLMGFDAQINEYFAKNVDNISKDNLRVLKPQLEAAYLSSRYKIEGAIFDKGQKFQKENLKQTLEQSTKVASDLIANGKVKEAQDIINAQKRELDSEWVASQWSPGIRKQLKEELDKSLTIAKARAAMNAGIADGSAEKVLKEAANKPPTFDNLLTAQTMYETYAFRQKANNAFESMLVANATNKLEATGSISPVEMLALKNEISAPTFAKFELQVDRWLRQNKQDTSAIDYFNANSDNSVALANLTDKELDLGFKDKVKTLMNGRTPTLADEATVANTVQTTIPSFNKKLAAGINSNDPETSVGAAQMYRSLRESNPLAVDGVDNKTAMKAGIINEQLAGQATPLEAWSMATKQVDNLTPNDIKMREELFQEKLKDSEKISSTAQLLWAAKASGFDAKICPPGMAIDFMAAMKRNYITSGDWGASETEAAKAIQATYGETHVNGEKQIVYLPIEKMWPGAENQVYLQNLIIDKTERLFNEQKELFNDPNNNVGFYFKFKEGAILPEGNILTDSRMKEFRVPFSFGTSRAVKMPIVRVDSEGNEVKGQLIISSDKYTIKDAKGIPPSYAMLFLPDGKNVPQQIFDTDFSAARLTYDQNDVKLLDEELARSTDKKQQQAVKDKKAADELKSKIIEMREALGEDQYYE